MDSTKLERLEGKYIKSLVSLNQRLTFLVLIIQEELARINKTIDKELLGYERSPDNKFDKSAAE